MAIKCVGCGTVSRQSRAKFCSVCGKSLSLKQEQSAMSAAREFVTGATEEAGKQLREAARHPATKKIAGGAAIGGAAGALLPVLTIGVGAALLGGFIAYKQLAK